MLETETIKMKRNAAMRLYYYITFLLSLPHEKNNRIQGVLF